MSAYAARLKSEMRPLLDELKELRESENQTPESIQRLDQLTLDLAAKKSTYDQWIGRDKKALDAEADFDNLADPLMPPRALGGQGIITPAQANESKGWFDRLTETKSFKRAQNDRERVDVRESMPSSSFYPFFEQKAPFAVTNPALLATNPLVINSFTTLTRHPLLDLISTVQHNEWSVYYLPLTFTNAATEVPWGTAKPESTNAGTITSVNMSTIAHWHGRGADDEWPALASHPGRNRRRYDRPTVRRHPAG
jgi:hypothetical protein